MFPDRDQHARRWPRVAFASALGILLITVAMAIPPAAAPVSAASNRIYWGAAIDGNKYAYGWVPGDMRGVTTFESHAGKGVSIIHFSQLWAKAGQMVPFNPALFDTVRNHGAIPLLAWGSADGASPDQPAFRNRAIANGAYDAYIHQWARDARAWGHPFFLRMDWEMDGGWYPWAEGNTVVGGPIVNGNKPGDFVAMWRHVHDIFVQEGATNATWVWNVNHESTDAKYAPLAQVYPGDAYVDWTSIDPYNRFTTGWLTLSQALTGANTTWIRNTYQMVLDVAPGKPMQLTEFASREDTTNPQRKPAWITDALKTQIPTNFPRVKAVLWQNEPDTSSGNTLYIESSPASQLAFAQAIASPYYASNEFANLSAGPIQPLGVSSVSLVPAADTYTSSAMPGATFGSGPELRVNGSPVVRAFLRFDLSTLAGKTLETATLRLRTTTDAAAGSTSRQTVHFVSSTNWSEKYMSANNTAPAYSISSQSMGTLANTVPNQSYDVALTLATVQGQVGKILSLMLDSTGTDDLILTSRDAAVKPQLVLTYH